MMEETTKIQIRCRTGDRKVPFFFLVTAIINIILQTKYEHYLRTVVPKDHSQQRKKKKVDFLGSQ